MPKLNQGKCFVLPVVTPRVKSDDTLKKLSEEELAEQLATITLDLQVEPGALTKDALVAEYKRFLLDDFAKEQPVRAAVESVCALLNSNDLDENEKGNIGIKITADLQGNCTYEFFRRLNEVILLKSEQKNLDDLLGAIRTEIVAKAARVSGSTGYAGNVSHTANRMYTIASQKYGVLAQNAGDPFNGSLSDDQINEILHNAFATDYSLFGILSGLETKIKNVLTSKFNYVGKKTEAYTGYKTSELEGFLGYINAILAPDELTIPDIAPLDDADDSCKDLNWRFIQQKLYEKLIKEDYITLSSEEDALLPAFFNDELSIQEFNELLKLLPSTLLTLFDPPGTITACLRCMDEWPIEKKQSLINAYLVSIPEGRRKDGCFHIWNDLQNDHLDLLPIVYDKAFFIHVNGEGDTPIRRAIKQGATQKLKKLLDNLANLPLSEQGDILKRSSGADEVNDLIFALNHFEYAIDPLVAIIDNLDERVQTKIWSQVTRHGETALKLAGYRYKSKYVTMVLEKVGRLFNPYELQAFLLIKNNYGNALLRATPDTICSIVDLINKQSNRRKKAIYFELLSQLTKGLVPEHANHWHALVWAASQINLKAVQPLVDAIKLLNDDQQYDIWKQVLISLDKRETTDAIKPVITALSTKQLLMFVKASQIIPLKEETRNAILIEIIPLALNLLKSDLVDKFSELNTQHSEKYGKAYNTVHALHQNLSTAYTSYLNAPDGEKAEKLVALQNTWVTDMHQANHSVLRYHRNMSGIVLELLVNVILLLSGIGTLYWLGKKARDLHHGQGLFSPIIKTQSTQTLDMLDDIVRFNKP